MRIFERLFVIALLLCSMQVVTGLTDPSLGENTPEVVSTELHWSSLSIEGAVYACGAFLILRRWRRVLSAARMVWPLIALSALALLSTLWSPEPGLTLRRSIMLLVSTLLAIYLGERYTTEKLARLLAQTLCLMMTAIIVFYFVAPVYVVDYSSHIGAWKGLSSHKNIFGEFMAEAVALLLLVRFRHFLWLRYVFLVTAVVLLWLSGSATSLFCGTLVTAAMVLWRRARGRPNQRLLVYAVAALMVFSGIYFLTGHTGLLLQVLNRDPSLTGRTQIWAMALPAMMKFPILGYGYDGFWIGPKGEALNIMLGSGWLVPHAHNGFLDLGLSLGIIGLCVFLYILASAIRRAIEFIRLEPGPIGLWPITYLCFFALHNITESSLLTRPLTVSFLMFAAITTSLAVNRWRIATASPDSEQQQMWCENRIVPA